MIQVAHKAGPALRYPQKNKNGRINYVMKQHKSLSEGAYYNIRILPPT